MDHDEDQQEGQLDQDKDKDMDEDEDEDKYKYMEAGANENAPRLPAPDQVWTRLLVQVRAWWSELTPQKSGRLTAVLNTLYPIALGRSGPGGPLGQDGSSIPRIATIQQQRIPDLFELSTSLITEEAASIVRNPLGQARLNAMKALKNIMTAMLRCVSSCGPCGVWCVCPLTPCPSVSLSLSPPPPNLVTNQPTPLLPPCPTPPPPSNLTATPTCFPR